MEELEKIIKDALSTSNGLAVGEVHFNNEISRFNDNVLTTVFIKSSKALSKKPVLLVEDNFDKVPMQLETPDGKKYLTTVLDYVTGDINKEDFNRIKKQIAEYVVNNSGRRPTNDSVNSVVERLEMYRHFVQAGGKVVSLDSSDLLNKEQGKRYQELLPLINGSNANEQERQEFSELVSINHANAIKKWSDTVEKYLADSSCAVMLYTGAGHIDLHQRLCLVSVLTTGYKITDTANMSYIEKTGKDIYEIDIERYELLKKAKKSVGHETNLQSPGTLPPPVSKPKEIHH